MTFIETLHFRYIGLVAAESQDYIAAIHYYAPAP